MGDQAKPNDDATWTEVERSFFAAAPPEELKTIVEAPHFDDLAGSGPEQPRREIAWLRRTVTAASRGVTVVVGAAGGLARRVCRRTVLVVGAACARTWQGARTGAAGVVAAFSSWRVDRRRLVVALVGAIALAAFGGFRSGAPAQGVTAQRPGSVEGPRVAEVGPVAPSASASGSQPSVASSAGVEAPGADHSNRPRGHRRAVAAAASAQRPVVTAYMDRQTYWSREGRSVPGHSSRPFFSR